MDCAPLAVLIVFDRFPIAGLGCYGNEWVDTTAFDELAADGFVFDAATAERTPSMSAKCPPSFLPHLSEWVQSGGVLHMVSEAAAHVFETSFATQRLPPCPELPTMAAELPFSGLMQAGLSILKQPPNSTTPTLLVLHSAGLDENSVPPVEAWELYADELAETLPDWQSLPDSEIASHPAIRAAYITLMDHWLQNFLIELRATSRPILLQLLSVSGLPWLPVCDQSLPEEYSAAANQIPWIVWTSPVTTKAAAAEFSHTESAQTKSHQTKSTPVHAESGRSSALVHPSDGFQFALNWLRNSIPEDDAIARAFWGLLPQRQRVVTAGPDGSAIVWSESDQVVVPSHAGNTTEVVDFDGFFRYVLPQDPWNAFNVAQESRDDLKAAVRWLKASHGNDSRREHSGNPLQ